VNAFWEFFKKPIKGEVYNMGGGRYSNCSIIEALNLVEDISNIKIKRIIIKKHRIGDHIWYISNLSKFKNHYPNWKQKYNTKKIIEELVDNFKI
jgi:CDP-paratose 2-epimerase